MTEVAKLVTQIVADSSKFRAEISAANASVGSFTAGVKAGSVVAVAALTAIAGAAALVTKEIFDTAEKVSQLYDNTQKLGVTVAAFQELTVAARENGVSVESLQNLIGTMNKKLGEAELSGGKTATAIHALGLSFSQLSQLSPDEKFKLIAERLRNVNDVALETAIATDFFGKAGKDGIALFNSNIEESVSKVRELGLTLTQSQAEGLDKLAETKDFVGTMWDGFKDNVAAEVAPAFQQILEGVVESVKGMGGLKDAAKATADYIVSAMNVMVASIQTAVSVMQGAKSLVDGIMTSKLGEAITTVLARSAQGFEAAFKDVGSRFSQLSGSLGAVLPKSLSDQALFPKQSFGTSLSKAKTDDGVASAQKQGMMGAAQATNSAAQALKAYKESTVDASKALSVLKDQAMKTATVLDSFHAIKDLLNTPSKDQANSILKKATSSANTESMLADTTKFQPIFDKIVKSIQNPEAKGTVEKTEIPSMIKDLQDIINEQKLGKNDIETGAYSAPKDVTGLTNALNELKGFLASKTQAKDVQVEVKIKVDASKDFVTSVTQTQSFKQAVDAEFDARTAAAARGDLR